MFEKSKWIWKSTTYQPNSYGGFLRLLTLKNSPLKAILKLSAHNHFKAFINGNLVSGYVSPAPSVIEKDKLYLEYDITSLLKAGPNKFEVFVLYLGGNGQNYRNGVPGFILECEIETELEKVSIFSDETWSAYPNLPYKEGMPFQQSRKITPYEFYDTTIHVDEYNLQPVTILKGYSTYHKQCIPEGSVYELISPELLFDHGFVKVFDNKKIVSGFPKLRVKSNEEVIIHLRYSEDMDNQRVKHNVANELSDFYMDSLKLKPNTWFEYSPDFTYKAFRYIEVEAPHDTRLDYELIVMAASTNIHIEGIIASHSAPEVNHLFSMFKQTQLNNTLGLLVDCPHREQAQYLGDSALQSESLVYNVVERKALLEKVLNDFAYAQYPDGSFPFVSPGNTEYDQFSLKIPEYDLYFIELLYTRYTIDQDQLILNKYHDTARKIIELYLSKIDETGLVVKNSDWHISDWPYPTVDHDGTYLTYENMLFYRMLSYYIKLYSEKRYDRQLDRLENAIKKELRSGLLYKDHKMSSNTHPGIQAFAILNQLVDEYDISHMLDYIESKGFASSIILSRYVIEALMKHGRIEAALTYIFDHERGWGHILRQNSQTMWEGFDDIESHSHAWGMYVIKYIQTYITGIQFDPKNSKRVYIRPNIPKRWHDLSVKVVTESGLLSFSYRITRQEIVFEYTIPKSLMVTLEYHNQTFKLIDQGALKMPIFQEETSCC